MAEKRIIPSRKWYPQDLLKQAPWWQNFSDQFAAIGAGLGFAAGVIAKVQDDNSVMQFLAQTRVAIEAYSKAIRQYTNDIRELPVGEPTPAFPADPSFTLPNVVPTGINQRLDELVDQIQVASGYTNEIGALLGIIPSSPEVLSPDTLKPVIKVFASLGSFKFKADVTRLGQPAFKVQISTDGTTWTDAAFATKNPVEVTVTPSDPTKPERIMVRAILLNGNEPVGEPSDTVFVTVNP